MEALVKSCAEANDIAMSAPLCAFCTFYSFPCAYHVRTGRSGMGILAQ